jgi:hypothetical protein
VNNTEWNTILSKLKNNSSDSFGYNNSSAGRHVQFGSGVNGVSNGLRTLPPLSSFQVNATGVYINGGITGSTGDKSLQIKIDKDNSYIHLSGNTNKISVDLAHLNGNEEAQFRAIELPAWDSDNNKFIKYPLKVLATVTGEPVDGFGFTPSYGLVGEEFVDGDVVTVTPCTAEGEAIAGAGTVDVYLRWDGASVDLSKDADGNVINCALPSGSVISYFTSSNGFANALTEPSCVVTNVDYSSDGIRSHHRWLLAGTQATEGTEPVARIPFYDVTAHQVQWDDTNKKLQYRTVTFRSPETATEGAWTDLIEGECLTADIINSLTGGVGGESYQ